jgi:hypothetical protein
MVWHSGLEHADDSIRPSLYICLTGLLLCVTWIYQNWLISAWANRERAIKPGRRDKPLIVCANPQIGRDTPDARRSDFVPMRARRAPEQSNFWCSLLRSGWTRAQCNNHTPGPFTKSLATQSLTRKLFFAPVFLGLLMLRWHPSRIKHI